ncbi:hypothetical protein G6F43_004716 [Rhizopus delemar]|nr:hypothetical protein G6F43_004716 [Rhizopus delemar]
MSFFSWNKNKEDNYELREVADLELLIEQMDSRNSLNIIDSDDDNSSESTIQEINIKHNYEYEEDVAFHGDEAEQSLVNNTDLERAANQDTTTKRYKKGGKKWICVGFLIFLLLLWVIWTIGLSQIGSARTEQQTITANHIDFPDLYNSSFEPKRLYINWFEHDSKDGLFTSKNPYDNSIMLQSIESDTSQLLVEGSRLKINNDSLQVNSFKISRDGQYVLIKTNFTKQWRYSSHSNVYIYDIKKMTLSPLNQNSTIDSIPAISHVLWSPSGHQLAYVMNNDLYITDLANHTRVTFDGSSSVLNGVLDWVYEEDVFGSDIAMWWSPDSTHLAYLRFDETNVPDYHLQYYTQQNKSYPEEITIKYPKPGAPNPLVSLHVYSLLSHKSMMLTSNASSNVTVNAPQNFKEFNVSDRIITDVTWATNTSTHLLFKQTNRVQDTEITSLVTIERNETYIENVRTYKPSDEGWVESYQSMVYLSTSKLKNNQSIISYVDILDNGKGYMHLAIIKTGGKKNKRITWLTTGKWEVVPGSVIIDHRRNLLHYISTEKSPLERHLYRIQLNDKNPSSTKVCLTCPEDTEEHAYYSVSFSPHYGYYVLNYEGPNVPKNILRKVDDDSFEKVLEDNSLLKNLLQQFDLPRTRMTTVKSGGVDMDVMEVLPPDFDATKKYPVLFHVYGGPGSQLVNYMFDLNWSTFLASKLGYIVVTVDGRGTGFKGRKYRMGVRGRLGELETIDQINAAKHWASLEYVDPARIAVWGWSYGGYMTTKIIEANSGLFVAGLAVAPVTDWRYYDSIYTERYMMTPQMNPDGYEQSAINKMEGFDNIKFLLLHGTADDNVHFQNSAVLVNKLIQANIHNYQVQYFPDSNHDISFGNANQNLYHMLTNFLWESFGGKEYLHVRKELNGHFSGPLSTSEH